MMWATSPLLASAVQATVPEGMRNGTPDFSSLLGGGDPYLSSSLGFVRVH